MKNLQINPIGQFLMTEKGTFIKINQQYRTALKSLNGFSHLNIIWWFSESDRGEYRKVLDVKKPYKNAPDTMGIFATRSPVRPNPLALSCVQIIRMDEEQGMIEIAYVDANDGSPILDIKPYTPSLDRVEKPDVPNWCTHWPISIEESGNFDWENEFNF